MNQEQQVLKTKRIRLPPKQPTLADLELLVRRSFGVPGNWQLVFLLNDRSEAITWQTKK